MGEAEEKMRWMEEKGHGKKKGDGHRGRCCSHQKGDLFDVKGIKGKNK